MNNYISLKDICERLSVSRATMYRQISAGKFPQPVKIGTLSRWPATAIDEYVTTLEQGVA